MISRFDLSRGFILSNKYKSNIYCDQTDSLQTYISSLEVMIDKKRKQFHLSFKASCDLKASNYGKYLIFLVTILFIREEWLRLLIKNRFTMANFFRKIIADK